MLVPLKTEKGEIGFVFLFEKLDSSVFNEEQIRLAEGYADIVSRAQADGILHRESQQKIEQMAEDFKSAIRRLERNREPAGKREIVINGLQLNGPRGIASYDSKPLELSTTEFELLYLWRKTQAARSIMKRCCAGFGAIITLDRRTWWMWEFTV